MIATAHISPYTKTLDASESRWFAIRVMSRTEKVVGNSLKRKGIEAYVPVHNKVRRYTRKVKNLEIPLLRGYVLVQLTQRQYVSVLETEHVVGFIRHDKAPAIIPNEEIELIRRVEGTGDYADTLPMNTLEPGVSLEIIGGELTGLNGRLVEAKGKDYVSLELIYLDTALILDIDKKYLRLL